MRVVHVTPYFAPAFVYGGPPRSILALCQGLQEAGVEVEVVTTVANGATNLNASRDADARDEYGGVPVFYAERVFPSLYFNAAISRPIQRALARADLCHIHGLWNVPEWTGARLATRMSVPFVLSPRGMLQPPALKRSRWRKQVAYQLFERHHLADATRLHATGEEEAAVLRSLGDASRVITIPNAVDFSGADRPAAAGSRARLGIGPHDPMIVFLGRIHPIKRLDLLAAAVVRLRQRYPGTKLVLAGPDEHTLESLRPALADLASAVFVTGELDDDEKWSLLREATALVLCSDSENFGTAVAEALASGCPVVATETCPWRQLVDEQCGYWVPQRADAIATALVAIVADPDKTAAMVERGKRFVRARFDRRAIGAAMAACYAEVLSAKRQVA